MLGLKIALFLKKIKLYSFLKMELKTKFLAFLLLISSFTYAQSVLVSGLVVDYGGNPLPGVTVLIEGTNRGASTTFEGT